GVLPLPRDQRRGRNERYVSDQVRDRVAIESHPYARGLAHQVETDFRAEHRFRLEQRVGVGLRVALPESAEQLIQGRSAEAAIDRSTRAQPPAPGDEPRAGADERS